MSGSVNLKTSMGDFHTFVEVPKGEPGNFMSEKEFRNKFDGLCQPYLNEKRREEFSDSLLGLEKAEEVASVFSMSTMEGN